MRKKDNQKEYYIRHDSITYHVSSLSYLITGEL